jgi:hypothetical protein
MTYSPPTRTVAEVMTAVKRQFGDESGVQVEDSDIVRWINDAQEVIISKTRALKAKSSVTATAGQASYTFPSEKIYQIESIHFDGVRIPNMPFAEAEEQIFGADPQQVALGKPALWYEWAGTFTFWPAPAETKTIDLYYTKQPARVTTSADILSVSDKYYQDVVRYVLQQAYEMDEDLGSAQAKSQQFEASINEFYEEDRTAQNMTYSTITIYED